MALVIFTAVVLAWARATDQALEAAWEANAIHSLRTLTAFKLSEIRAKPTEFWEGGDGGFEAEVDAGEDNPFADFRWEVEAQEVSAAGHVDDDDVEHVYPLDEDAPDSTPTDSRQDGEEQQGEPEAVRLLRLTLIVTWVPGGDEASMQMKAVTYVERPEEMVEESER